jgi:hypothetical protein
MRSATLAFIGCSERQPLNKSWRLCRIAVTATTQFGTAVLADA